MAGKDRGSKEFCIYAAQLLTVGFLAAGWWGIIYPDFAMTDDMYEIVCQEEEHQGNLGKKSETEEISRAVSGRDVFYEILESGWGKVQIKSRFLELLAGAGGCRDEQEQCTDRGV